MPGVQSRRGSDASCRIYRAYTHLRRQEVILLSGDLGFLKWLVSAFSEQKISKADEPLILGDGLPVSSDGRCLVQVTLGKLTTLSKITATRYVWQIDAEELAFCREKIDAMIDDYHPCHQYFDMSGSNPSTVVLSSGEYSVETIRAMRDSR